jgi:hypothetical protein
LHWFDSFPVSQSIVKDRFMSFQMAMPRLDSYSCSISAELRIIVVPSKILLALLEVPTGFLAGSGWPWSCPVILGSGIEVLLAGWVEAWAWSRACCAAFTATYTWSAIIYATSGEHIGRLKKASVDFNSFS